jgi:hypothetical protein
MMRLYIGVVDISEKLTFKDSSDSGGFHDERIWLLEISDAFFYIVTLISGARYSHF